MTEPDFPHPHKKPVAFTRVRSTAFGGVCTNAHVAATCCQSPILITPEKAKPFPEDLSICVSLGDLSLEGEKVEHPLGRPRAGRPLHPHAKQRGEGVFDTVKYDCDKGSTLTIKDGGNFTGELQHFHVHFPAEHKIIRKGDDGKPARKQYDGEVHFVFQEPASKKIGVVGVFIEEGERNNPVFEQMLSNIKVAGSGSKNPKPEAVEKLQGSAMLGRLFPSEPKVYYTLGSLTVPDPTKPMPQYGKGVHWIIMDTPVKASREQIDRFRGIIGTDNNRPLQPINGRDVFEGTMQIDKSHMRFVTDARRDLPSVGNYGMPGISTPSL